MHVVLSNSLAVLMLVHSLLGCCWHHAHDGDEPASSLVATTSGCQHGHEHSDHHPTPCQHRDEGGCPGGCVYVSSARPQLSKTLLLASLDCVVALPALDRADNQLDCRDQAVFEPAAILPVRLHLLHQILLI